MLKSAGKPGVSNTVLASAAPQRIPDSPSEVVIGPVTSLNSSLGEDFPDSSNSHLGKMPTCQSFVLPSLPPSSHPRIIQWASNKVYEVSGTRKNRSNSGPGSVFKELTAQPNISSHLQSPERGPGRGAWRGFCICSLEENREVRKIIYRRATLDSAVRKGFLERAAF